MPFRAVARMDRTGIVWYFSGMISPSQIPVFNLFGETGAFPDIIHCERIRDRAGLHDWTISPHRHHEMAQVFFMRAGTAQVRVDGRQIAFDNGEIIFIPAGIVHGFAFSRGSEGLVLSFPLTVVPTGGSDAALARILARPHRASADPTALGLMEQIAEVFSTTGTFRANLLVALSQALFAAIARLAERQAAATAPPERRRMDDFGQLIARHMAEGWGVADYASALSVTAGHLNRICRAATGTSAGRHIEIAVMTEASRLLAFTQLPVAEVGYRLGFDDPSYFSRRFRALRGEAPSDYRRRFAT